MAEDSKLSVRRIRVSYVEALAHDDLHQIGEPEKFSRQLLQPKEVTGIGAVTLPFPDPAPEDEVNWLFWSHLAETDQLRRPKNLTEARKLLRFGVPLRHAATLTAGTPTTRLPGTTSIELHLLPYGLAAMVTTELVYPDLVPVAQAMDDLDALAEKPFTLEVGDQQATSTLAGTTSQALDLAVEILGSDTGHKWSMDPHRVVTVIDGQMSAPVLAMPVASGPYHHVVHRLANGPVALGAPLSGFVPGWAGGSFDWAPAQWVYMLTTGSAMVDTAAVQTRPDLRSSTSSRHRRLTLIIAHVSVSGALIDAANVSNSLYFPSWAHDAAFRMGRLYGPKTAGEDFWGLETRHLLEITGVTSAIVAITGTALTAKFPAPTTYPTS